MSALTRKPPIDGTTVLQIVGPAANRVEALKAVGSLGFCETNIEVSWESVFPDSSPGTALRGARYKEDVTQQQLAEMTRIPQRHISEMENNKRRIGKDRAKRLGKALNVDYRVFL